MIRLLCPKGHLIASVDINESHAIIPRTRRHGLSFDYAPSEGITRIRTTCPKKKCGYDGSTDYGVLRDALAAVPAPPPGEHAEYRLTR